jgi:hypothetical protein
MMRALVIAAAVTIVGALDITPGSAVSAYDWNLNVHTDGRGPVTSCSQLRVSSRDGQVARDEQAIVVPASVSRLTLDGVVNGGVHASGTSEGTYRLILCKFAVGETIDAARTQLSGIRLSEQDGAVSLSGPASDGWTAHVIVLAPAGARMTLATRNGPLGLHDLSGEVVARTTNGPLAVHRCSGDIQATANNGPISVSESSGHVRVSAQNGPLSVNLSGGAWDGEGLEAHTVNGPLSLRLPDGYGTGVQVAMSRYSPLRCRASLCSSATLGSGAAQRDLRFGPDDAPIRLSSHNGPVSIAESGR